MVAGWEKRLRHASFRGVAFGVLDYSTAGGRRVVLHEYPFQDENYPEDLGQVSGKYRITAFMVGDDHDLNADALEEALLKPGKAVLVHPRHGTLDVQLLTYDRSESTEKGGMTKFSLELVKAFKPRFPVTQVNVQAQVLALQNQVQGTLQEQANMTIERQSQQRSDGYWLVHQLKQVSDTLNVSLSGTSALPDLLNAIVDTAVFTTKDGLLSLVSQTLSVLKFLPSRLNDSDSGGWLVQAQQLALPELPSLVKQASNEAGSVLTMIGDQTSIAVDFIPALTASTLITQIASASALIEYESYDAAILNRDYAHQLLDAAQVILPVLSNGEMNAVVYEQWRGLRALIAEAIQQQALTLPRIAHVHVGVSRPALDIAYQIHADSQQVGDLLIRNGIEHPLFVAGQLEYLHG